MLGHDDHLAVTRERFDETVNLESVLHIQTRSGLIEEERFGSGRERTRHQDTSLLTSRQGTKRPLDEVRRARQVEAAFDNGSVVSSAS